MCLIVLESVLEIALLVMGAWMMISGKVSERFFQATFGSGNYVMSPRQVRVFGLFLASPLPVMLVASAFMEMRGGRTSFDWSAGFEVAYDVGVVLLALIIARKFRQPSAPKAGLSA